MGLVGLFLTRTEGETWCGEHFHVRGVKGDDAQCEIEGSLIIIGHFVWHTN